MKIERFEDIKAWQEARTLTKMVYEVCNLSPFSKDFGLRDQIQRATVSTMSNIAEGFDSQSDTDFIRFLVYSFRSATEVQSHLYVAVDQKYVEQERFQEIYDKTVEVKKIIRGFIRYLEKNVHSPTS